MFHAFSSDPQAILMYYFQQRSQPDDLGSLCKYLQFTDCENNQFLKKWIMIILWILHSGTKLSGWLRHRAELQYHVIKIKQTYNNNYKKSYTTYSQGEERREPAEGIIRLFIIIRLRICHKTLIKSLCGGECCCSAWLHIRRQFCWIVCFTTRFQFELI